MIDRAAVAKFLLFVGICCMAAVPANANCPVENNPPECPEFPVAPPYFPHEDCNFFYQCSNGIAYCIQCPDGLYFNPTLYVCDWSWNVECKADAGGSEEGDSEEGGTGGEDGTTVDGDSEEGGTGGEDGTTVDGDSEEGGTGGEDGTTVEGDSEEGGTGGEDGTTVEGDSEEGGTGGETGTTVEEDGSDEGDGTDVEGSGGDGGDGGSGGGDGTIVEGSGGDGGDVGSSGVVIEPW